jgi:hypothetical protein
MPLPPPQLANIASTANPNAYLSCLFRLRIVETQSLKIVPRLEAPPLLVAP